MKAIALNRARASCPYTNYVSATPLTRRAVCYATDEKQQTAEPSSSSQAESVPGTKVYREFRSLGSKVIETDQALAGPEDENDFWEGEQFESFGKLVENFFLPGLLVLGLVCGGIAAATYNDGATFYMKGATSPEDTGAVIVSSEVLENQGATSIIAPSPSSE